jgi:hypothetical protein
MRKTGVGLIVFAVFLHFLACDWDLSCLTVDIPSAASFFFGIMIPFLLIPVGILIYRSNIKIPHVTGGLPKPRPKAPPRPKPTEQHMGVWPPTHDPPPAPQLRPLLSNIRCPECDMSYAWDGETKVCGNCNYGIDIMKGVTLAKLRLAKGWDRKELAKAIGVSVSTIARWERSRLVPKKRVIQIKKIMET